MSFLELLVTDLLEQIISQSRLFVQLANLGTHHFIILVFLPLLYFEFALQFLIQFEQLFDFEVGDSRDHAVLVPVVAALSRCGHAAGRGRIVQDILVVLAEGDDLAP